MKAKSARIHASWCCVSTQSWRNSRLDWLEYVVENNNKKKLTLQARACSPADTHAPYYTDSGTYDCTTVTFCPPSVPDRRPISLRTACQTLRWRFFRVHMTRPTTEANIKHTLTPAAALANAFLPLAVRAAALLPPHGLLFICGGNGGGRILFYRRRKTCSSAAASRCKRRPFGRHTSHNDTDNEFNKLIAIQNAPAPPQVTECARQTRKWFAINEAVSDTSAFIVQQPEDKLQVQKNPKSKEQLPWKWTSDSSRRSSHSGWRGRRPSRRAQPRFIQEGGA